MFQLREELWLAEHLGSLPSLRYGMILGRFRFAKLLCFWFSIEIFGFMIYSLVQYLLCLFLAFSCMCQMVMANMDSLLKL